MSETPGVLDATDARRLQECVSSGGIAVFPAETVYGICCDPDDERAVAGVYELKGRPPARPSAIMFFDVTLAIDALPELAQAEHSAVRALLPGAVTLLLPNLREHFALACGPDPDSLGVRVPALPDSLAALSTVSVPIMQTSANLSGEADARRLTDVPQRLRDGADLVLDGGELPGTPSTVVDLRSFAATRRWQVLREGAMPSAEVRRRLEEVE